MAVDYGTVAAYAVGIVLLYIIARVFLFPMKVLVKLLYNALIGGVVLIVINYIGGYFNFHLPFNIINAFIVGLLGIPGIALLIILKFFLGL